MRRLGALLAALLLPACAHAAGSAVLQDASHQVTITDHVHGSMMFAPSLFGAPASAGILNNTSAQPLYVTKGVATTGVDVADFYATRTANYAGGTPGFVNSAWRYLDTVSAGTKSFEWTLTSIMDNSASAADATENVAIYAQAKKRNGGGTWASVSELMDYGANPTTPSVTHEYDLEVTGADSSGLGSRVILDGWAKSLDGNPAVVSYGIRLNTDANTTMTNGFTTYGATIGNAAIALGVGQKLCLDTTICSNYLTETAGTVSLFAGGAAQTFNSLGANLGQVNALSLATSGNVIVSTNQKLCLNGATCSAYILFDGTNIGFYLGGTVIAQIVPTNGGRVNALRGYAIAGTPGVDCLAGSHTTFGGMTNGC